MNVVTMALKDLKLLVRDPLGLFWVLGFPLIMALFFGSVFGGEGGSTQAIRIALVDQDRSSGSRAFVAHLRESAAVALVTTSSAGDLTPDSAEALTRSGKVVAAVVIPPGFGVNASQVWGPRERPRLTVRIDPSRKAEAGILQGVLMEASFVPLRSQFQDPGALSKQLERSLAQVEGWEGASAEEERERQELRSFLGAAQRFYAKGPAGEAGGGFGEEPVALEIKPVTNEARLPATAFEVSFPSAILWAILGSASGFAISLVRERKDGTLQRLLVGPHSSGQILASKALACFVTCVSAALILSAIGKVCFGVRTLDFGAYLIAILATAACFVGVMMLLSVLGKTEEAVGGGGWGIMIVMSMLGGGMVPLFAMPSWMRAASQFSPVSWGILALEGAVWRGSTWAELGLRCGVLLGVGALAFALGARRFKPLDAG